MAIALLPPPWIRPWLVGGFGGEDLSWDPGILHVCLGSFWLAEGIYACGLGGGWVSTQISAGLYFRGEVRWDMMLTYCGGGQEKTSKRWPLHHAQAFPYRRGLLAQNPGVQLQYKLPGFCCEPLLWQSYIHPTLLSISFTCLLLSTNGCFDVILVVFLQFWVLTPEKRVA